MRQFSHCFEVRAPIERVAEFHRDTQALRKLSPPPMFVTFNKLQPLAEGSLADFTLWLGPIPVRWVAVHSAVDPRQGFTDSQKIGPFDTWVHRHTFRSLGDQLTEVIDEIQAEPGKQFVGGLVSRLMWLGLPVLFAYRAWQTRRSLEK